MLKKEVQDRVVAAKSRFKGDYVKRDASGNIEEIHCRACGTLVAGYIPGTQSSSSAKEKLTFRHFANFRMIQFKLSDGSGYRTNMCADCVNSFDFSNPAIQEELFASDIVGWSRAAEASGISPQKHQEHYDRIHSLTVDESEKHSIQQPGVS